MKSVVCGKCGNFKFIELFEFEESDICSYERTNNTVVCYECGEVLPPTSYQKIFNDKDTVI